MELYTPWPMYVLSSPLGECEVWVYRMYGALAWISTSIVAISKACDVFFLEKPPYVWFTLLSSARITQARCWYQICSNATSISRSCAANMGI